MTHDNAMTNVKFDAFGCDESKTHIIFLYCHSANTVIGTKDVLPYLGCNQYSLNICKIQASSIISKSCKLRCNETFDSFKFHLSYCNIYLVQSISKSRQERDKVLTLTIFFPVSRSSLPVKVIWWNHGQQIAVGDKFSVVETAEGQFSVIINPVELR